MTDTNGNLVMPVTPMGGYGNGGFGGFGGDGGAWWLLILLIALGGGWGGGFGFGGGNRSTERCHFRVRRSPDFPVFRFCRREQQHRQRFCPGSDR